MKNTCNQYCSQLFVVRTTQVKRRMDVNIIVRQRQLASNIWQTLRSSSKHWLSANTHRTSSSNYHLIQICQLFLRYLFHFCTQSPRVHSSAQFCDIAIGPVQCDDVITLERLPTLHHTNASHKSHEGITLDTKRWF